VLGRLGLLLAARTDERQQRHVDVTHVVASHGLSELPDRLEEREDLDVADRAADLRDHHIDVLGGDGGDPPLDLVGHMGDDLDGLAEVVAAAFLGDDRLVDRTGRGVAGTWEVLVDEPFVVTEVEVGLAPVVGDEHLTVFERVHGARIDVEVRIELLHGDAKTTLLEEPSERSASDSLAE
jgi:hypothetical protein